MKTSNNTLSLARQQLRDSIAKIPKKNRGKFMIEYMQLIEKAQNDDYCKEK